MSSIQVNSIKRVDGTESFTVDSDGSVTFAQNVDITGGLTVDTNTLYVDAANNSVGIGTTSVNRNLDVVGTTGIAHQYPGSSDELVLTQYNTTGDAALNNKANASLYFGTNNTERMRITSSGRVGIGTTTPSHELTVAGSSDTRVTVDGSNSAGFYLTNSGSNGITIRNTNNGDLEFLTVGGKETVFNQLGVDTNFRVESDTNSNAFFVEGSSGNVGIGTSSPTIDSSLAGLSVNASGTVAQVNNVNGATLKLTDPATGGNRGLGLTLQGTEAAISNCESGSLRFGTGNAERMRIDSSGNLLVGKTTDAFGTAGTLIGADGLQVTRSAGSPVFINRLSSDGTLTAFYKSGSLVGSIGVFNTDNLFISGNSTHAGLGFSDAHVEGFKNGSTQNGTIDLGSSGARFKDLFLSGGIYLGGTGAANKLEDYEEGSWSPTYEASGASWSYTYRIGHYVKIGSSVWVSGLISISSSSTNSNQLYIINLPFTVRNTYAGVQNVFNASVGRAFNWATAPVGGMTLTGTTKFELYKQIASDNTADSLASDTGTTSAIFFSLRYETDS